MVPDTLTPEALEERYRLLEIYSAAIVMLDGTPGKAAQVHDAKVALMRFDSQHQEPD